jgi:hypothetical protein
VQGEKVTYVTLRLRIEGDSDAVKRTIEHLLSDGVLHAQIDEHYCDECGDHGELVVIDATAEFRT